MKRVIKVQMPMQENKYVLSQEYNGFGIYQEMSPNGYKVHQSWLIHRDNNIGSDIVIQSYNNVCYDELLDMIDSFLESGEFCITALKSKYDDKVLIMHPSGDDI